MGRVIDITVARAADHEIRAKATDGGAVTALLQHLLDSGRIDGAIVAKQVGPFQRAPFLALTREEIRDAAGFYFDTSHGMKRFSDLYMTHAAIEALGPMTTRGLQRVALVGTPCQIQAVRRMQAMALVPADAIRFCLGLFCSGNFIFDEPARTRLALDTGFCWDGVKKVNIKDKLYVHLASEDIKGIDLGQLEKIRRHACRYCQDYAAEYADISFCGLGAAEGWTSVVTRTPLGRAAWVDAGSAGAIQPFDIKENAHYATDALKALQTWSDAKKRSAQCNREELAEEPVPVKG